MPFFVAEIVRKLLSCRNSWSVAVKRKMLENAIAMLSPELTTSNLCSFPGLFFCHKFTCLACVGTLLNLLTILNHFQPKMDKQNFNLDDTDVPPDVLARAVDAEIERRRVQREQTEAFLRRRQQRFQLANARPSQQPMQPQGRQPAQQLQQQMQPQGHQPAQQLQQQMQPIQPVQLRFMDQEVPQQAARSFGGPHREISTPIGRSDSMMSSSSGCSTPRSQRTPTPTNPPPIRPKQETYRQYRARLHQSLFGDDETSYFGDDEDDEDCVEITPADQLRKDRKDILHQILGFFDARWLAPFNSPLFTYQKRKTPNPDGSFSIKKYEELNLRLWVRLIRRCLEQMMGPAYLNSANLVARFRFAARKIVTKRRANHVQNWKNNKTHKRLIYGGQLGTTCGRFSASAVGRGIKREKTLKKKRLAFGAPVEAATAAPVEASPIKPVDLDADFDSVGVECDSEATMPYSDQEESQRPDDESVVQPPVSGLHKRTSKCIDCGQSVRFNSCFPRDEDDWQPSIKRTIRCGDCWDLHVQNDVMPQMNESIAKKNGNIKATKKRKAGESEEPTKKKRKKRPCKCGSTTHSMRTHLDCPLNPRNLCVRVNDGKQASPPQPKSAQGKQKKKGENNFFGNPHDQNYAGYFTHYTRPPFVVATAASNQPAAASSEPAASAAQPVNKPVTPKPHTTTSTRSTTPPQPTFTPLLNMNVFACWKKSQYYLAHVIGIVDGRYNVYFVEDSNIKNGLRRDQLRPVPGNVRVLERTQPARENVEWFFEGDDEIPPSRWKVRRMGDSNDYVCSLVSGGDPTTPNIEKFDIGYVLRAIRDEEEVNRRSAPK